MILGLFKTKSYIVASNEKPGQQGKKSDLARNEIRLASKELGPD